MIKNEKDLCEHFSASNWKELERNTYKFTDCGAWVRRVPGGVQFGTIVEGSDAEFETTPLLYPFSKQEVDEAIHWLENEADAAWDEANNSEDE